MMMRTQEQPSSRRASSSSSSRMLLRVVLPIVASLLLVSVLINIRFTTSLMMSTTTRRDLLALSSSSAEHRRMMATRTNLHARTNQNAMPTSVERGLPRRIHGENNSQSFHSRASSSAEHRRMMATRTNLHARTNQNAMPTSVERLPRRIHGENNSQSFHSRAYATLLTTAHSKSTLKYMMNTALFARSVGRFNSHGADVVVLYTDDIKPDLLANLRSLDVPWLVFRRVERYSTGTMGEHQHYASTVTKLHVWNLTEYEQVAYFDSDMIVMKDPAQVFDACGQAEFCAVRDYPRPGMSDDYFNSGFMVLRPSADTFAHLLNSMDLAKNKRFGEQDMLNSLFNNTWKRLPGVYNVLKPGKNDVSSGETVALHEKWWELRAKFPEPELFWNAELKRLKLCLSVDSLEFSEPRINERQREWRSRAEPRRSPRRG